MIDRDQFRRGVEAHDVDIVMAAFADDAVLYSPVTFKPFVGKSTIKHLLRILLETFIDFTYTDELISDDGVKALIFKTKIGDKQLEGLDLIRFNDDGEIQSLTVMVRPRSGLEALRTAVGLKMGLADPTS